ncbi:Uncharacterised protein [Mycobacteroides abscessus subsp. abscessus]|nr:Uncharacterised protein [Mycobacteroides abscessus subsp. abscessus]
MTSGSSSPVSRFLNRNVYRSSPTTSVLYASHLPSWLMASEPRLKNSWPSASTLASSKISSPGSGASSDTSGGVQLSTSTMGQRHWMPYCLPSCVRP